MLLYINSSSLEAKHLSDSFDNFGYWYLWGSVIIIGLCIIVTILSEYLWKKGYLKHEFWKLDSNQNAGTTGKNFVRYRIPKYDTDCDPNNDDDWLHYKYDDDIP